MEGSRLINGGAANPIRPVFWEEDNDSVTSDIKANLDPTPISCQVPQDPSVTRASQDWVGENITIKTKFHIG